MKLLSFATTKFIAKFYHLFKSMSVTAQQVKVSTIWKNGMRVFAIAQVVSVYRATIIAWQDQTLLPKSTCAHDDLVDRSL